MYVCIETVKRKIIKLIEKRSIRTTYMFVQGVQRDLQLVVRGCANAVQPHLNVVQDGLLLQDGLPHVRHQVDLQLRSVLPKLGWTLQHLGHDVFLGLDPVVQIVLGLLDVL